MNAEASRRLSIHRSRRLFSSHERPTAELMENVDRFVTLVTEKQVNDKKVIDLDQLIEIKDHLHRVVESYEMRPEFKIREEMSARVRELDGLIANAEKNYAERKREHDTQVELLDRKLTENHRHVLEVQRQTLVTELKNMNEYLFYHGKIIQQIADIDASLDAESCCSRFFCCFFPSKEIVEKQKQLKLLRAEQDAFASEDRTVVSQILMKKIEEDRAELLKQQAELAANQPKETAQLLREERTQLQSNIDAEREAYYRTISPQIMLNLVRLQSFVKRMQRKLQNAKSAAQAESNIVKEGLLSAVLAIVNAFQKKFDDLCQGYVCRPPANEANKISYAQYCDRYHRLQEHEKKSIIKGEPEQSLIEHIFVEHTEPQLRSASVAAIERPAALTM